jgi:hypothetical protein
MQLWFLVAITGMVLAGISNFGFKIAAKKGFDAQTFTLYGGFASILITGCFLLIFQSQGVDTLPLIIISLISGAIAA